MFVCIDYIICFSSIFVVVVAADVFTGDRERLGERGGGVEELEREGEERGSKSVCMPAYVCVCVCVYVHMCACRGGWGIK